MDEFAKFVIPKAMRLIRLMRLFIDSVGPLVTKDLCFVVSIRPGSRRASFSRFSQVVGPRGGSLVVGEVTDESIEVVSGEIWVTIGIELS